MTVLVSKERIPLAFSYSVWWVFFLSGLTVAKDLYSDLENESVQNIRSGKNCLLKMSYIFLPLKLNFLDKVIFDIQHPCICCVEPIINCVVRFFFPT